MEGSGNLDPTKSYSCKTQNDNFVLTSISQSLLTIYRFRALIGGRRGWPKVAEVTANPSTGIICSRYGSCPSSKNMYTKTTPSPNLEGKKRKRKKKKTLASGRVIFAERPKDVKTRMNKNQ